MVISFLVLFLFGAIFSECQLGTSASEANTNPTNHQCEECYMPFYWDHCPLASSVCINTSNLDQVLSRIQCFYNGPSSVAYVDVSGNDGNSCGSADGSQACQSFNKAKVRFRYNTTLIVASGIYHLEPPANLTGHKNPDTGDYFPTYYSVKGTEVDVTFIYVSGDNYDNKNDIIGDDPYSVVLYVSSPGTSFNVTNVTLKFNEPPARGYPGSVLVWVRNEAVFLTHTTKITGDGQYWPEHLFEQSGGNITLINTIIAPTAGSGPIQAALLFWDDVGKIGANTNHTASHSGSWTIKDCTFENITFNSPDSILSDSIAPNNCVLNVSISGTNFKNIRPPPPTNSRIRNPQQKALIFSYGNTKGSKYITETGFRGLDSTGHTAPLAVLAEPAAYEIYEGLGLTITDCIGGSASGTIAAYASINKTNTHFGIKEALGNTITNADGSITPSNTITPMSEGVIVCLENLNVNCPVEEEEPKKFPIWAVVVIIVVAVVVVAAIVVVVAIAVYFHKKKYSTLPDDDYNESSSSSLRSTDRDDEIDSI